MSSAYNKFQIFVQDIGRKVHNLNSDTLKEVLTNTAPVATNNVLADLTQIANGNGYVTGGATVTGTAYSHTTGTATLSGTGPVWTASGGTVGPFRYVSLYNDTAASDQLVGYWDYGSSITLQIGETFTVDHTANIFTLV